MYLFLCVVKTILLVGKMVTATLQARNFMETPDSEALDFGAFLISAIRAKIFLTAHT
jgi:hypothetical protein